MFEFLAQRDASEVSAAADLAIQFIADRATVVVPTAPMEWEGASESAPLAIRIVRAIEAAEGDSLTALSESKARRYVRQLSAIIDATIDKETGQALESAREEQTPQLLKELRDVAIDSIGTWSPFEPLSLRATALLAGELIGIQLLVLYLTATLWPSGIGSGSDPSSDRATIFGVPFELSAETRLLLLVMLGGALGSATNALVTLVRFVGNRLMRASWVWWYATQPLNGVAMAITAYFVCRSFFPGQPASARQFFVLLALATLTGYSASRAAAKLGELLTALFRYPSVRIRPD